MTTIDRAGWRREALGQLGLVAADPRWPARVLALLDVLEQAETDLAAAHEALTEEAAQLVLTTVHTAKMIGDSRLSIGEQMVKHGYAGMRERAERAEARIQAVRDEFARAHEEFEQPRLDAVRRALDAP